MRPLRLGLVSMLCGCGLVLDLGGDDPRSVDGGRATDATHAELDAADARIVDVAPDAPGAPDASADGGPLPACGVPTLIATIGVEDDTDVAAPTPSLAWTGDGFGLVWSQLDGSIRHLYYTRIDASGLAVAAPVPVTGMDRNGDHGVLVWNGASLALAWEDSAFGPSIIRLAHLDRNGSPLDGPFEVSTRTGANADRPDLAWSGSGYGLVWEDAREGPYRIYYRAFDASGRPAGDEQPLGTVGIEAREARIASSGAAFAVAWHEWRDGANHVAFTSMTGGATISFGPSADDADIAWIGSGWAIAYEWMNDLGVTFGDPTLTFSTPEGSVSMMPGDDDEPSLAWTGSELGIAFEGDDGTQVDIHFASVDGTGTVVHPVRRVDDLPGISETPSLVWTGDRFAVAWAEGIPAEPLVREIYFAWICP